MSTILQLIDSIGVEISAEDGDDLVLNNLIITDEMKDQANEYIDVCKPLYLLWYIE